MKLKKVVIVGTIAVVITINPSLSGYLTSIAFAAHASKASSLSTATLSPQSELNNVLGVSSDKEVYDALLEGQSLADIAEAHGQNADSVIGLQIKEMQEQLQQRLEQGSLTQEAYEQQLREIPELIAGSVHSQYNILT
ncbi:hypothetical protein EHV15_11780 [Paenibacillus oralis]|uniref:SHOCT domain-containing protein n=1 Tax=Paenibacillus oralis TaxID=2490856 RepID=A0A3P3U1M5_9BACL|nr:hypothetical protein [Paenibacillus oralis]RRJ63529.1 hypothetical protein EHV15_11780 [Paenibacillus oralis]